MSIDQKHLALESKVPLLATVKGDSTDIDFLAGGGEMGKLVHSMDWSQTPLGSIKTWSQSLKTTVSLCLASNFPISLAWGSEFTQIYNDGYWPICGDKHPNSMGQDFRECWATAWPIIGDAFNRAIQGETSYLENQRMFLDRNGYMEETFFTFSFSPIRDETGNIGGLFHPVTEQTSKMLSERRTRALRDLSTRTGKAKRTEEVFSISAQVLSEYDLDLPFILCYEVNPDGKNVRLVANTGLQPGTTASPTETDMHLCPWPLLEVIRTGQGVQVDNLETIFGPLSCGPYPESPKTAFVLPLSPPGAEHPTAIFIAGASARLPLTELYENFYDLLAATLTASVANAQAYEEERKRAEALAAIDRAKTAFFSNVSHEFRTPLTLMLGPIEDALNDADTLPQPQRYRLDVAHRNALRLQKLVNSLLDFSRIEAGRIQAAYVLTDLSAYTAELASMFRSAMEKAGLTLTVDCPPLTEPVYIDQDMWEKIVMNLLSNAFKHTFTGEIQVQVRGMGSQVDLIIRDTGIGVPSDQLPHLFERFHRVPNAKSRTHEGSGIGLALVYELVKLHGGNIAVESTVDQGTTFTISIPTGKAHLPAERIEAKSDLASTALGSQPFVEEALRWLPEEKNAPSEAQFKVSVSDEQTWPGVTNSGKARILLADDNRDMREYVCRLLETYCEVEAVSNGFAAWEAARAHPPDLVLSDIMMPQMDGFELLKALRSDPVLKTIPVILLSARAGEEARVEGLEMGADDYLTKPFNARELLASLKTNLDLHRTRQQESLEVLRESEERFRNLFSQAAVGFAQTDLTGKFVLVNDCYCEIVGRTKDTLYQMRMQDITHPDDLQANMASFERALKEGSAFKIEKRYIRPDGSHIWVNNTVSLVKDQNGSPLYMVAVSQNIMERKQAEAELLVLQGQLEARVLERTAQLQAVNKELEAFSYSVSHDLRAPLRTIDGFSQAVLQLAKDKLNEKEVDYLNRVREGSQNMSQLINDMLNLSRLTRGELTLNANVDLSRIAHEIADEFKRQEPDRSVEFNIEEGIVVQGDKRLLQAVLQNLIGNSWKYTSKHASAHITFGKMEDGRTIYYVKDDGAGFNMKYVNKLFGAFQRLHRADQFEGTGVGLATIARIIHRHGGEVWGEGEIEKGATFYFTLKTENLTQEVSNGTGSL